MNCRIHTRAGTVVTEFDRELWNLVKLLTLKRFKEELAQISADLAIEDVRQRAERAPVELLKPQAE